MSVPTRGAIKWIVEGFLNGVPLASPMASWDQVERRLQALVSDPARMARWFQVAYYVSTGVVVLGVVVALLVYAGVWAP